MKSGPIRNAHFALKPLFAPPAEPLRYRLHTSSGHGQREGAMADNETASFAVRWAERLPGRWARNGAIFGALMVFAQYSVSQHLTYIFQHPSTLRLFIGSIVGVAGIFALITFLLGLWARWSLSPIDEPNLTAGVRTILRKWVVGALVLGVLMILADVAFQWRGQIFAVGGTPDAIAANIGYVLGVAIACVAVGLITGYVSRRGLKKQSLIY